MTAQTETTARPEERRLPVLDEAGRALLFHDARTPNTFTEAPVSDAELAEIWQLAKWPPTAANTQPLRVLYVRTAEGRERLAQHLAEGNRAKTLAAPVVAVLAVDSRFHDHIPTVFPMRPQMRDTFEADPVGREATAAYSGALQAGYFLMAVRAMGLAAGPMAGFDRAGVDEEFFAATTWRSTLVVNIGHPGVDPWFDRLPRLDDETALAWA